MSGFFPIFLVILIYNYFISCWVQGVKYKANHGLGILYKDQISPFTSASRSNCVCLLKYIFIVILHRSVTHTEISWVFLSGISEWQNTLYVRLHHVPSEDTLH